MHRSNTSEEACNFGIDLTAAKACIDKLRRQGEHQQAGTAVALVSAGLWFRARLEEEADKMVC